MLLFSDALNQFLHVNICSSCDAVFCNISTLGYDNQLFTCTISYGFSVPDCNNMCQETDEGSTNSSLNAIAIPHLHEELSNSSVFCFHLTAIFGSSTITVEGSYALDSQDDTNSGANSVPTIVTVVVSLLCAVIVVFILIILLLAVAVVWRRKKWVKPHSKHSDNTIQ